MSQKPYAIMHEFVSERFPSRKVLDLLKTKKSSNLIELSGKTGSGKSYLAQILVDKLRPNFKQIKVYSPHPFYYNQLEQLISLTSGLSAEEFSELVSQYQTGYKTGRKYDFFYYIISILNERKLLKPMLLIVDDCDVLDSYSRDYLQYLVHSSPDVGIKIVVLTQSHLFGFSTHEPIPALNTDAMQRIIQLAFPDEKDSHASGSEVLQTISGGNLMVVENILAEMLASGRSFDLSPFLERNFDPQHLYFEGLNKLDKSQKKLLFAMFALDGNLDDKQVKNLGLGRNLKKNLEILSQQNLIADFGDGYKVQRKSSFMQWLENDPEQFDADFKQKILAECEAYPDKLQVMVRLQSLNSLYNDEQFKSLAQYLEQIADNENAASIWQNVLKNSTKPMDVYNAYLRLGIAQSASKDKHTAIETFREALQFCTDHSLAAEEIVWHLASQLFDQGSGSVALEIIKKYSPATIDEYWKQKILLLKADILTEMEMFDEAMDVLDDILHSYNKLEDKKHRYQVQADAKKIRGKIQYYISDWEQAEEAFKEAEKMYNLAGDKTGLAAIYNNLGVLFMFQADWQRSEQYFLKSLAIEQETFNLNGISVCYNNLGGLMDDKGDQTRSLFYLEEAINLQKLLNEPYNIANIYNNIGITFADQGDYAKAEDAHRHALDTSIEFGFYRNSIASLNNLGALYFKMGEWSKSIEFYEQAIAKSEENSFNDGLIHSYSNLGELYEKQGELNLAYDLCFKGLELLPNVNDQYLKADLYGNIGSVLTRMQKFKEAYPYLSESLDFFKSINAGDKIVEGYQKQAYYFILSHSNESADYYINESLKMATEQNSYKEIGQAYYLKALLEKNNPEAAREHLNEALRYFVQTNEDYKLSLANYELAQVLFELEEWEKALEILKNNKKIIQRFGSIKLLEQNDILSQKISREYAAQMQEMKFEENLLNQFYEITQKLNTISDLDLLIEQSLDSLIELSDASGGILVLHSGTQAPDNWDYKIFRNIAPESKLRENLLELCSEVYQNNEVIDLKQPHFAPSFNNLICIPLSIRNDVLGVVLLFTTEGSYYFPERIINLLNALANQVIVIIENIRNANLEKSHAIIREQLNASNQYANIIGNSPQMEKIFEIIDKVKDTPTTVLLEGPSGTGKELIARALHYTSNRRNKKFVAQYCGALPETLLESELFGHVKGSFTGAINDKKGLFEIADGGTFFLDEIADISPSTQAKLLRFLQEGEVKRVGATKTEKVDVRVVCATNTSLMDRVNEGTFRLDLYYRLNVVRIEVPPLSAREGDIPLLAIHFLDKYTKRIGKEVHGITEEAMKILEQFNWPGNVRQLENEIERAVTLAEPGSSIKPTDFSDEVLHFMENMRMLDMLDNKQTLKEAIEELERKMIVQCMEECDWNQTQAAKELGLSRQGLIKKLARYNLNREEA